MLGSNAISGLFSGIDSLGLVEQLIQADRRPAYLMEGQRAQANLQMASFDAIKASLESLKGFMNLLRQPRDFQDMTARTSHYDVLTPSAGQGAQAGSYSLVVENLAQSHQTASQGFAASDSLLGLGTVAVSVGGEELVSIELTEGNNTLAGLAETINNAGSSVGASVINTGSGSTPYQLILTNGDTGASNLLTLETNLTGGSDISIGSVDAVVIGSQAGSSTVASSGHYTGAADANFTFTVATGGTIGTDSVVIDWTNDLGDSGQVSLDGTYVAGSNVDFFGSGQLSFGAGDLQAGDNWTVATTSGTIQAAQDAKITMGTVNPITVYKETNTVTDLIEGVTLNLLKADADETVTVTVERDINGIMSRLDGFVTEYNNVITFMQSTLAFDENTETPGVLLGDTTAMRLDSRVRNAVVQSVEGLASSFTHLIDIGIGSSVSGTLDEDGLLSIDTAILRDALTDDMDSVIGLLAGTGTASDDDINFLNAGYLTAPTGSAGGYDLTVTQAATKGYYNGISIATPSVGTPLVLDATNNKLELKVDGIASGTIELTAGSYTDGASLASMIENQINADSELGAVDVTVAWIDDGGGQGHLDITSKSYGGTSSIHLETPESESANSILGLEGGSPVLGQNVEGYFTVDGVIQTASGSGRTLTGDQEDTATRGLSVEVNLTEAMLASQGESQGSVSIYSGVTDRLHRLLDSTLASSTGTIAVKQEALQSRMDDLTKQVERIDQRLEIRKNRYIDEFIHMEQMLAEMNTASSGFLSMLQGIPNIGSSLPNNNS